MAHRHTPSHSGMTSRTSTPIAARGPGGGSHALRASLGAGASSMLAQAGGFVSALSGAAAHAGPAAPAPPPARESKQTSYEWVLRDACAVQAALAAGHDDAVEGPVFDDGAYKLHLGYTPAEHADEADARAATPTPPPTTDAPALTLAVIALWATYADVPPDEPFERAVFVGLHRLGEGASSRRPGALGEPDWLWHTSDIVSFSKRDEYWETRVPSLRNLVAPPKPPEGLASLDVGDAPAAAYGGDRSDANGDDGPVDLALRVVIKHSTDGAAPLVHADQQFIARRITRQAAALLDSPTADITFVVLETETESETCSPLLSDAPAGSAAAIAAAAAAPPVRGRKRTLGAHSAVLTQLPYFASLLTSGLAESSGEVTVDDAEFATLYWVLYYVYTDEVAFAAPASGGDDVRALVARQALDGSAVRRALAGAAWDWATIAADEDGASEHSRGPSDASASEPSPRPHSRLSAASTSAMSAASLPPPRKPPVPPRTPTGTAPTRSTGPAASSAARGAAPPQPAKPLTPSSPRYAGPRRAVSTPSRVPPPAPDPHVHPTAAPAPAPALAIYVLAHRYGLDALAGLAHASVLAGLAPATCVSVLLATHAYADLHADVLAYITDNWADVAGSPELDRCFQEVSSGVWGEHAGGLVLAGLMRRLTGV